MNSNYKHTDPLCAFLWLICLLVSSASIATAANLQKTEIVLVEGTPIKVILNGEITTSEAKLNDPVDFTVVENVVIAGRVVVRTGTHAIGTVIKAENNGYLGKSGKLAIRVDSTQTVDGKRLKINAAKGTGNDSSFLSSPLLFQNAGPGKIPAGTLLTVYAGEEKRFRVEGSTLIAVIPNPAADPIVYIYRPKNIVGSALEPSVFVDNIELARMDNGRYITIKLKPGKHVIRMTDDAKSYSLDMEPGQTYYFRIGIEAGIWKGQGKLMLDEAARAKSEISKLKFISQDKIKAPNLVVDGTPQ